jgi:exodeoxyribonuclease VII small subunit
VSQANDRQSAAPTGAGEAYDVLVSRLERVVSELEGGTLTLEQSIEKFAEGVRLARDASRKLDDAERRVEMLVKNADGDVDAVALDAEGGRGSGSDAAR